MGLDRTKEILKDVDFSRRAAQRYNERIGNFEETAEDFAAQIDYVLGAKAEEALSDAIESQEPEGEVFYEEGSYDPETKRYEQEGKVPTYEIGGRRIAVLE
ncbi:hypothetical protein [Salinibacter ruber]|uniref:Uncharacterized protein n=1 Tax=Salinibacter ruber TaxID=146919 RepID=A0AAW5P747_9BACT|nr:hypothetical protein [Salinibacter ruber]MCS4157730.1 hypothetical protein [Salinibacter ruber]